MGRVRNFTRSLRNLAKTDPLDTRMIARFMAFRPDSGRHFPLEILRHFNVLTTKRCQLVACKKTLTCQVRQRGSQTLKELGEAHLALLADQISALETRIETVLQSDDRLKRHAKILRSIPGVGPVLTAALIGQMPELGSLSEKRAAALVASNHNPTLKPFAQRLKEKGKPHKLVLVAVARKIIIIANALIAKNIVWSTI